MQVEYALTDENRERVFVEHLQSFQFAPVGLNTMNHGKAERLQKIHGGQIVPVVLEDDEGPCCYIKMEIG